MHLVTRWKELKQLHPRVRTFYLLIMGYLTKITNFNEFESTIRNIIILCNSERYGKDKNGLNSLDQEAYEYIKERVQDSNLLTLTENLTESEKEINIDDDNDLINDSTQKYYM